MISPLASPFRGGWRNLTPMRARGRGGQNPWTPALLAPYAWYDVHAGGTSSTIADTSGNGRADATYGATTAAPLYLPYTGTPYLHLEAAGAGMNSLSCTAPANTASYAAYPLGGGAATTGAASAGAFTFTTAGDWTQLDLLDGSAVVLASFRAADSGQTGHTDAFSVAWTINRGTAGRKSVILGPAAGSTRSVALLGGDDYIDVPTAAIPALDTFASPTSVVAVFRRWHNPGSAARVVFTTKSVATAADLGVLTSMNTTASNTSFATRVGDGTNTDGQSTGWDHAFGARGVGYIEVGNTASRFVATKVNSSSEAVDTTRNTLVTTSTGGAGRIGATTGTASNFIDMEFEALLTFDRALTSTELGLLVTYYQGGS